MSWIIRRLYLRKNTELTILRIMIVVLTIVCFKMLLQLTIKDRQVKVFRETTPSVSTVYIDDSPKDPMMINSWPSRLWDYRAGNRSSYLTIAIPSVRRPNTKRIYLYETLSSIISNTGVAERTKARVIVFLIDQNNTYNMAVKKNIVNKFNNYIASGFISVVSVNKTIYPDLRHIRKTFNDSIPRLKWRAKQNIDFAYMFWYSRHISQYYLQLEDGVIVASGYVKDIQGFVNNQNKSWYLLEFSKLGFIGKLFQSKDLKWSANVLFKKYDVAPCDLLLGHMRKSRKQHKPIHYNVSLFQHIGKFSSLRNKLMPSIDKTFKDIGRVNVSFIQKDYQKGDNPPAKLSTNIEQYEDYRPLFAYDGDATTYFWGTSQRRESFFKLTFDTPQNISRIMIVTGDAVLKKDHLKFGLLKYSVESPTNKNCEQMEKLVDFVDGEIDTLAQGVKLPDSIRCLLIYVKKMSRSWLIIRRIEVFLK